MRSPFEIFRKHQKMLTVILTGLAMFAFVILGAVQDPANMSPMMSAVILACVIGGIAWVAGIRAKKSNEWGMVGVIVGLVLGIAAAMAVRPQAAVRADTGNIDEQQLRFLFDQRQIANQFVTMAYERARENGAQFFEPPPIFRYHIDANQDIVAGELLRREADRLGIEVTDEAVNDFIRALSQGKIGSSDVRKFRDLLQISETDLYMALKEELKAREAWVFLYGGGIPLPPEAYWDFYRKMNIQQSVGIIPVPVDAFLDKSIEPPDSELQELFAEHKANFPNVTIDGRLNEGVPGFRQPRKVALEYVEIPYEAVEQTIGEITDAEIEAFYEENYKSIPPLDAPSGDNSTSPADEPILPQLGDQPEELPEGKQPADPGDSPDASDARKPEGADPIDGSTSGDVPQPEREKESSPQPPSPETPSDADDAATGAAPGEGTEGSDGGESDETPSEGDPGAFLQSHSTVQLVSFLDDNETPATEADSPAENDPPESPQEPPADAPPTAEAPGKAADNGDQPGADPEKPAESPPADDKPAHEAPADAAPDSSPPDTDPDTMKNDDESVPAADEPAGEAFDPMKPRELDDDLRAEIRDQILRRKTADRQEELMFKAFEFMAQDLAYSATTTKDDPEYATTEETSEKLQAYAKDNGLIYDRTPLLSQLEFSQSEEYPIGHATPATNFQSTASVAQLAFQAGPTELYRAERVMDLESGSRFVFWKIEDVAAYEPSSLEDPGIREQVIETWRDLQARERAETRANELAKQAEGIDKPLSEIFAETTVTGNAEEQQLSVVHPPRFSWLSRANPQMSPNPFNRPPPTLTELRTVPGRVGESFMEAIVNGLRVDEVGVTHSIDKEYFYVVRVEERAYGPSPDVQAFRERFTNEPLFAPFGFSDYSKLADDKLRQYRTSWAEELFAKHQVDLSALKGVDDSDL